MLTNKRTVLAGAAVLVLLVAGYAAAQTEEMPETELDASFSAKHWTKDGSYVSGRYVSFSIDAQTGLVTDYARKLGDETRVIFTSIQAAEYDPEAAKARVKGPALLFADANLLRGVVFDAKNAAFGMGSPAGNTITLVVRDGIEVSYHEGEAGWSPEGVLLREGNATARLVVNGDGDVNVDGQTITVTLGEGGKLGFRIDGHKIEELKQRVFAYRLHKHVHERMQDGEWREQRAKRMAALAGDA